MSALTAAQRVVDGRDRNQLERLRRYLARPPLAHDRLARRPDGRLSLSLKTPWSDGTEAIVLSPMDLIARLCALVPPPRMHMTHFFGVLASASKHRAEVVPKPEPAPELRSPLQLSLLDTRARASPRAPPPATPRPRPTTFDTSTPRSPPSPRRIGRIAGGLRR
jgi:hypothetical protein